MKKILLIVFLWIYILPFAYAAPPSRVSTYTSGTTIKSADVTGNEDAMFTYLQAGVDTIKDNTIVNADVNSSAAIGASKLNLTTVTQNVAHSGTLTQSGSASFTTITDLGTVTTADINAGTWQGTIDGNWTAASQTCADLGTVTTTDINGGTMDGVQVDGETATGMLFSNDASDYLSGLGTQGFTGQFLKSAGPGVQPDWDFPGVRLLSKTTLSTDTNSGDITISPASPTRIIASLKNDGAGSSDLELRFNSDSGNNYSYTTRKGTASGQDSVVFSSAGANETMIIDIMVTDEAGDTTDVYATGTMVDNNGGTYANTPVSIYYNGAAAITSFEFLSSAANKLTGNIFAYEYDT